jgi:hypothetical protein
MTKPLDKATAIGVDIGTSRIVTAHRIDQEDCYQSQLNAFLSIPFSKLTESSLRREGVSYSLLDGKIFVYGNESATVADLIGEEVRRPMTKGVLNAAEPGGLEQIHEILHSLLGRTQNPPRLCVSVPAPPLGSDEPYAFHEATLRQMLGDLGFTKVTSMTEGMAVIYSELEDTNYSGIGVSCGGGLCNVSVAYLSVPILNFSVPKGGDYIDSSAAAVTGEMANRVRITKEDSFHFNGFFSDKVLQALSVYYDDMIQAIVRGLKDAFQSKRHIPKLGRPVPLVLSGGGTLPKGFSERFEQALGAASLPFAISEVRTAKRPLEATARGALVAALTE